MNVKKLLPVLLLVVLAIATLAIKNCNNTGTQINSNNRSTTTNGTKRTTTSDGNGTAVIDRNATDLFFTKHAKCRMKCRQISQQEVKAILQNGTINYSKSNLQDPRGPTYALEGNTNDGQHVRIIFAPKQAHMTVVTVIDLGVEHQCSCD